MSLSLKTCTECEKILANLLFEFLLPLPNDQKSLATSRFSRSRSLQSETVYIVWASKKALILPRVENKSQLRQVSLK